MAAEVSWHTSDQLCAIRDLHILCFFLCVQQHIPRIKCELLLKKQVKANSWKKFLRQVNLQWCGVVWCAVYAFSQDLSQAVMVSEGVTQSQSRRGRRLDSDSASRIYCSRGGTLHANQCKPVQSCRLFS